MTQCDFILCDSHFCETIFAILKVKVTTERIYGQQRCLISLQGGMGTRELWKTGMLLKFVYQCMYRLFIYVYIYQ